MGRRRSTARAPVEAPSPESLVPPVLDPGAVEAVGVVRAAIDAARALPGVARARGAAATAEERVEVARAVGGLARRAAAAYAAQGA